MPGCLGGVWAGNQIFPITLAARRPVICRKRSHDPQHLLSSSIWSSIIKMELSCLNHLKSNLLGDMEDSFELVMVKVAK
nr:hypothetical protein Iba_chr02eCG0080 [Ipomoea batatas]